MSAQFHLYRSNATEELVRQLAVVIDRDPLPPLEREVLVVHGRGMEVWLSHRIAEVLDIWMGADFVYPRNFVDRIVSAVGPGESRPDRYTTESMTWGICRQFFEAMDHPHLDPIAHYLAGRSSLEPIDAEALELAQLVALAFDRYLNYRPEWLLKQATVEDLRPTWQRHLWQCLESELGNDHLANRFRPVVQELCSDRALARNALPKRVCIFGVSSMPPVYVQMLVALSHRIPVHWFMLSPSRHYWWDADSKAKEARRALSTGVADWLAGERPLRVLGGWGRLGAELRLTMANAAEQLGVAESETELPWLSAPKGTLLGRIQNELLDLDVRGPVAPPEHDESFRVNICHTPLREVEVLRDALVAYLAADATRRASDVLVMAPDIELYSPLIEAVFSRQVESDGRIPFRIADRSLRGMSPMLDAFVRLLNWLAGRANAEDFIDLLRLPVVHRRCGMALKDVDRVARWIVDCQVRWGFDPAHRVEVQQPETMANTWRDALNRLLIGLASPVDERDLVLGVLPYDEVEGAASATLGQFADLIDRLGTAASSFREAVTWADWRVRLLALSEAVLDATFENRGEYQRLAALLDEVVDCAGTVGFQGTVDFSVVCARLEMALAQPTPAHGFVAGGVTFCAMMPMRAIPFRLVVMLGLDGSFPRQTRINSVDETQRPGRRERGDRSTSDDDRYLMLEALLSAREALWVSYAGMSARDNQIRQPSVLLEELVEYAVELHDVEGSYDQSRSAMDWAETLVPWLVVRHRAQPFDPHYFAGGDSNGEFLRGVSPLPPGRSRHWFSAASASVAPPETRPFVSRALPPVDESQVRVADVERFLRSPQDCFLQQRCGFAMRDYDQKVEIREPTDLDNLETYSLGTWLIDRLQGGVETSRLATLASMRGVLPPGAFGQDELAEVMRRAMALVETASPFTRGSRRGPEFFQLAIGGRELIGDLPARWSDSGLCTVSFGHLRGKRMAKAWFEHLLVCAVAPNPHATTLVGSGNQGNKVARWAPLSQDVATTHLEALLTIRDRALREPIPLFAVESFTYARAHAEAEQSQKKDPVDAARRAVGVFRPEGASETIARFWPDATAVYECQALFGGASFHDLAIEVFGPLVACGEGL